MKCNKIETDIRAIDKASRPESVIENLPSKTTNDIKCKNPKLENTSNSVDEHSIAFRTVSRPTHRPEIGLLSNDNEELSCAKWSNPPLK
jgi:hypothetical protein